jgi:hypothetical protein
MKSAGVPRALTETDSEEILRELPKVADDTLFEGHHA